MTTRKAPVSGMTEDEKRKMAAVYKALPKAEKAAFAEKHEVSVSALNDWYHKFVENGSNGHAPAVKKERNLEELLWHVVILAKEAEEIDLSEAKRLLELVR